MKRGKRIAKKEVYTTTMLQIELHVMQQTSLLEGQSGRIKQALETSTFQSTADDDKISTWDTNHRGQTITIFNYSKSSRGGC